ncbi:MAG TPA: carbonic anhydrase [Candidatus Babeliales bacterium]|nr:carbonic anhydrase [Candidatus Babeliales bacterium]
MLRKDQQKNDPEQVLQELIEGNERFRLNSLLNRGSLQEMGAQASKLGQFPKAVVLSCMDSRSIPEVAFDQSIGDIFTLRIAGNVVNKDILASIEYAIKYAGIKLIVIMGHTDCAAIRAAFQGIQGENLSHLLNAITPAVEAQRSKLSKSEIENDSFFNDVSFQNVSDMIDRSVGGSSIIRDMIIDNGVALVGALHNIESGLVSFKYAKGIKL